MITGKENKNELHVYIEGRIDDEFEDVSELISVQTKFLSEPWEKLYLHFENCSFINAAVSVIIGTLPIYARKFDKVVKYRFDGSDHPILRFMRYVGMYKYYMKTDIDYKGDLAIPFDCIVDENKMDEYADKILELAPIKMNKEARDILSSYIIELFQNGFFHSNSLIGVFASGFWIKEDNVFTFSIYDMGEGIPNKVRNFLKKRKIPGSEAIDSERCLRLAFVKGFSTDDRTSRGLGLYVWQNFVQLNHGKMSLYSDDICCIINQDEIKYYKLKNPIKGTLIIIKIIADENHIYRVVEE